MSKTKLIARNFGLQIFHLNYGKCEIEIKF